MTRDELASSLSYDPQTGVLTRISGPRAGHAVGTKNSHGYLHLNLKGRYYKCHRLAWLYMTGGWPDGMIDHINGNRSDNRFCNLRIATPSENSQNRRAARSDNKTGLLGVSVLRGKFMASIGRPGSASRSIYLGLFKTQEEAHAAYLAAKRKLHSGCTI